MTCEKTKKLQSDLLCEDPATSATNDELKPVGVIRHIPQGKWRLQCGKSWWGFQIWQGCCRSLQKNSQNSWKQKNTLLNKCSAAMKQSSSGRRCWTERMWCRRKRHCQGTGPWRIDRPFCSVWSEDWATADVAPPDPCALKEQNMNNIRQSVMWKANVKAWVSRQLFMEWLHKVFAPTIKKSLSDNWLPQRCLLLMDNAQAHTSALVDDTNAEYDFRKVKFVSPVWHSFCSSQTCKWSATPRSSTQRHSSPAVLISPKRHLLH